MRCSSIENRWKIYFKYLSLYVINSYPFFLASISIHPSIKAVSNGWIHCLKNIKILKKTSKLTEIINYMKENHKLYSK